MVLGGGGGGLSDVRKGGFGGGVEKADGTDPDVEFSVALAGCAGSADVQAEALGGMATGRAARVRKRRDGKGRDGKGRDGKGRAVTSLGCGASCWDSCAPAAVAAAELFHTKGEEDNFCMLERVGLFIFPALLGV